MIYLERVVEGGKDHYYSLCLEAMKKRYDHWVIPARILEITPAEYVRLLIEEYKAEVRFYPPASLFSCCWKEDKENAERWNRFINEKSLEKKFYI